MYAMEKLSSWVYTVSGPFHPFGGAVDIIVVQQEDGSYKSSPWYVRFGKFQGVLKTKEKVVTICVNGEEAKFHMYLDHKGEAYFLKEWDFDDSGDSEISSHSSGDEIDENDSNSKFKKAQSCNFDGLKNEQIVSVENEHEKIVGMENMSGKIVTMENGNGEIVTTEKANGPFECTENGNGKILNRTRSKRAMLYRLMFGSKQTNGSIKFTSVDTVVEEVTANEAENGNNGSLKSELASTDNKRVDDNFNKSVTTGKDFDDLNPYSNSDCTVEELNDSHKEEPENCTVNLDIVLENNDGEVKSVIHAETPKTSSIRTERNGNMCCTLLTEPDSVIESSVENNLELSSSQITCITQDSLSNSLQDGSNDVSPRKVDSCEPEVICQGQEPTEYSKGGVTDTVGSAHRNSIETSENGVGIQIPESLDDVQFQFSHEQSNVTGAETMDSYSNFLNEDVEKTELEDRSNEECSSSILTTSGNHTSPMDIPKSRSKFEETDQLLTKSLPIIRSEILDLDRTNDLHPLSSSLKLNSEMLGSDSSCLAINASSVADLGNKQGVDSSPINSFDELTESKHSLEHQDMISTDKDVGNCNGTSKTPVRNEVSWRLWPFGLKKSKTINAAHPVSECITQENIVKSPMRSQSLASEDELERAKLTKKKVSLAPTSEELASLNLKEGPNSITFSFSTSMLGQQQVDARIYLWKWNTRIVISDVDGTITKSDVLGQFMPLVGKDWSQTGVAHLFSAIKENGYEFIFLSARSISQAYLTRQFLMNLKQDGKALPDGPVVISPDGLFPSLYREVIRRAPHEFKISCLEEIKALFPPECNPFYAGFGNRDTDEFSYLKVGIPKGKIFIINPKGEVVVNRRVHDSGSYTSLHGLVDGMFPPATAEVEEYNPWNFWRIPPPDIDV